MGIPLRLDRNLQPDGSPRRGDERQTRDEAPCAAGAGHSHQPCSRRLGTAGQPGVEILSGMGQEGAVLSDRRFRHRQGCALASVPDLDIRPSRPGAEPRSDSLPPTVLRSCAHGVPVRTDNHGQQGCEQALPPTPTPGIHAGQQSSGPAIAVASQAESANSILVTPPADPPGHGLGGSLLS
jgi:hypothetical protein